MKVQTEKIPKKVHMIAVCGTGMGALALLMREAGVHVTGSDLQFPSTVAPARGPWVWTTPIFWDES